MKTPRMARPGLLGLAACFTMAGAVTHRLSATSYLPISDGALADRAAVIVEVRVVGSEPSPEDVLISTDYTVEVERVLKGVPGGSTIVVRIPGGEHPSGVGLKVFGAPYFAEGEHALLFLRPGKHGAYAVEQLMLGAFHRIRGGRRAFWVRDLSEAHSAVVEAGEKVDSSQADLPRRAERFSAWLADRAHGLTRAPDYWADISATEPRNLARGFRLYGPLNYRWFAFDEGRAIRWSTSSAGQNGLPNGGHPEFQRALAAWNDDPDTNVNFIYAGQTATLGAFGYYGSADGLNVVAFDYNDNGSFGTFDCVTGGLMSWSALYTNWPQTRSFRGREVYEIIEADIATIPGVSCIFDREPDPARKAKVAEELFGHALGHALGLGDSSDNRREPDVSRREALMYAFLHADGRGARLTSDDRQGLRQLYGASGRGVCRPSALTLCLQKGRFAVEAFYSNPYDGNSGAARAMRSTEVAGFFSFHDPANIELAVKILDFGDTFRVFYGQLTDFDFTLAVTDTKTGEVRSYQRAGGDCGAVDAAAFPSPGRAGGSGWTGLSAVTAAASVCQPGPNTLCLLGGRFRAAVDWHNQFDGSGGSAKMVRQSDLAGSAYYHDKKNLELVIKILDLDGAAKVFYAPLSDLEYTLRIDDLATGRSSVYRNGVRESCGGQGS
jgi:hypothetical protein